MTEELSFEAYLSISQKKFGIYLLDKKNLKNIYKEELQIENDLDIINYNLLSRFLDSNIFKIEKLTGEFLKNITIIIDNHQILNSSICIKKKIYENNTDKQYLQTVLTELKDLFKENYQNNKIIHIIVNRYSIDDVNYNLFNEKIDGDLMCMEVSFISAPNILTKEVGNVMKKYQIKIDRFLDGKYIANFFEEDSQDLSINAFKINNGQNQNEIDLVPKSLKKNGFFEKFFQLFS